MKVLIVDDSSLFRRFLTSVIASDPNLEVCAAAADPFEARDMILKHEPDVITLDVEMPRMDGLTFLRKIQRFRPTPTVMVSSLTQSGTRIAVCALEEGAIAAVPKPGSKAEEAEFAGRLLTWVRTAGRVGRGGQQAGASASAHVAEAPAARASLEGVELKADRPIVIGSSTGGPQALTSLLTALPAGVPPILIAQHMPKGFTAQFAQRLNETCAFEVREAAHGDRVQPGLALIAPGDHHMVLVGTGAAARVELRQGPKVHHQRPAVDVLFESVAERLRDAAIGVILTGMGRDGADGLLAMRRAGAVTLGQDEASCVVYGMPRVAAEVGAVAHVLPLGRIPGALIKHCSKRAAA